jgi:hypothetical protein
VSAVTGFQVLEEQASHVPYPLQVVYELWLQEKHSGIPVVLVRATDDSKKISSRPRLDWVPLNPGMQDISYLQSLLRQHDLD